MKKFLVKCLFLFFPILTTANPIAPQQSSSLFEHLNEVNKEWSKFYALENLNANYFFNDENQRIQTHLNLVENHLRNNVPKGLSQSQLKNRTQALDILKRYFEIERFPVNHYHAQRQPYFIDKSGTACAVGHLIIKTGFESFAQQISKENNYAYISELAIVYPELKKWAKEFGFTLEELAWIQPAYPSIIQTWNQVGNGGEVSGVINKMESFNNEKLYIAGDFTEIDGTPANSIITWDGSIWSTLGHGVTGEIFDIYIDESEISPDVPGRVYIAGNFYVNDNPNIVNVAFWENGVWNGLETSSMIGEVYSFILLSENSVIIGGNFEVQDSSNNVINNLAVINLDDNYAHNYDGALSVNGMVTDMVYSNTSNNILIAGDFTETATSSSDTSINHLETLHIAYWQRSLTNWTLGFEQGLGPISSVLIKDGFLYTSAMLHSFSNKSIGIFGAGLWSYNSSPKPIDESLSRYIYGIESFGDHVIFYGNIRSNFALDNSKGVYILNQYGQRKSARFDNPVTAVKTFQEQVYFAGTFTSVNDQNFSGLVSTPFDDPTSNENQKSSNNLNIYSSPSQINIQYQSFSENFDLKFYNMNGQLVSGKDLPSGSSDISISTQGWTKGIYVYQAVSKSGKVYSGKVSVM